MAELVHMVATAAAYDEGQFRFVIHAVTVRGASEREAY